MSSFDWKFYVGEYEDLRLAGITNEAAAKNHWIRHGKKEGRICLRPEVVPEPVVEVVPEPVVKIEVVPVPEPVVEIEVVPVPEPVVEVVEIEVVPEPVVEVVETEEAEEVEESASGSETGEETTEMEMEIVKDEPVKKTRKPRAKKV